jgi:glycosyltransferase involved in cell wall biosynthesis
MLTVGIVRHQLFRPSEVFITMQAMAMRTFQPLFIGRDKASTDSPAETVSVRDFGSPALFSYALLRRSPALREHIKARHLALLHAHFGVEGVYAQPLAKALGVPLVTTLHGFDVTIGKRQMLASRKLSWVSYVANRASLFDNGAVFVCVSEHIRRKAIDWGYPADRLTVLPIGVDVERIQPVGPVTAPRIVHVARLVEKKGTADLLAAFAQVRRAVPDAELVIIGDGPLHAQLTEQAQEAGIAAAVRFRGAQPHPEVLREIGRARVLCLPSVTAATGDQEGLPTVLLEAAAAGKPVVSTRHGGIPEGVHDGVTGFTVAEHDRAALAERLIAVLRDDALAADLGWAGRDLVAKEFNLATQTAKLESLYGSLL